MTDYISSPKAGIRCVYAYYRRTRTRDGTLDYPYYIGKGTIRRAYDWIRHNNVRLPMDSERVHILAKDMSDVDACQAEVLLIYLLGRKLDTKFKSEVRPQWSHAVCRTDLTGKLENRTLGGDGPASNDADLIYVAEQNNADFWANNPCFSLVRHADGHWYSPQYPKIKNTHGKWSKKSTKGSGVLKKKKKKKRPSLKTFDLAKRVDDGRPTDSLTTAQKQHYQRYGHVGCNTQFDRSCTCRY
jgi:hypothetical protein